MKNLQVNIEIINNTLSEKEHIILSLNEEIQQLENVKLNLEATIVDKNNTISALKVQLEQIILEKSATSETFATQEKKILDLNNEIQNILLEKTAISSKINDKTNELTNITKTLTESKDELVKNIKVKDEEIKLLKQKIVEMTQEKENICRTMNDSEKSVCCLTNEIESLKSVKAVLEELGTENEMKLQKLKSELKSLKSENSKKDYRIQEMEKILEGNDMSLLKIQGDLKKFKQCWSNPKEHPAVKEITSKLEEATKKLNDKKTEIMNLNERLQTMQKSKGTDSEIILAQEEKIGSMKNELEKITHKKRKYSIQLKENEEKILQIKEEYDAKKGKLKAMLQDKDMELSNLKIELQKMKTEQQTFMFCIEEKMQLISELNIEIDSLNVDKNNLEKTIKENENNFKKMIQEIQAAGDSDKKVIEELKSNYEKLLNECDKPGVSEINNKLLEQQKLLQEKETEMKNLTSKIQSIDNENKQLQIIWTRSIQRWKNKLLNLENVDKSSLSKDNVQFEVKTVMFEEFLKQVDVDMKEFENLLEKTHKILIEKEKELSGQRNLYNQLQNELQQTKSNMAETKQQSGIPKKTVKDSETCDAESFKKMQEEKEFAIGQVEFLNSIIVDMQQKNELLQTKIQMLENGALGDALPDTNVSRLPRVVPPRKYCDICELFDLHETEDCPIQMDEDPIAIRPADESRKVPEPRPYCDICEEFGHNTENCDADETY